MSRFCSERTEPIGASPLAEYEALRAWLHRDTAHSSRIKDSREHPAFAKIVEFGGKAVPFILSERNGGEGLAWVEFELLRRIFGDGPEIPEWAAGRLYQIQQLWAAWFSRNCSPTVMRRML